MYISWIELYRFREETMYISWIELYRFREEKIYEFVSEMLCLLGCNAL
jgi:hypothetical protein